MSTEDLRRQLYSSFTNRAMVYYHIFKKLKKEVGREKATVILKKVSTTVAMKSASNFRNMPRQTWRA
jgi:hypothetical protein